MLTDRFSQALESVVLAMQVFLKEHFSEFPQKSENVCFGRQTNLNEKSGLLCNTLCKVHSESTYFWCLL